MHAQVSLKEGIIITTALRAHFRISCIRSLGSSNNVNPSMLFRLMNKGSPFAHYQIVNAMDTANLYLKAVANCSCRGRKWKAIMEVT